MSQRWMAVTEPLDIGMHLVFVRQIAETLRYAHERRFYHQTLSPQTILVTTPTTPEPQIKIVDWQSVRRDSTSTGGSRPTAGGSLHLDLFGDQQSLLYMPPEAIAGMAYDVPKLDVFALGAVAYHIFSGQAPAASIEELHQKCYQGRGLRISEVMDGAGKALQELIQLSTAASVEDRLDSMHDFLDLLDGVENELTTPAPETIVNPIDARVNDHLAGGFIVKKRLGERFDQCRPVGRTRRPGGGAQSRAGAQSEPAPERRRSDLAPAPSRQHRRDL